MRKFLIIISMLILASCRANYNNTYSSFKSDLKDSTRPQRAAVADFLYPEVEHSHRIDNSPPPVYTKPFCYKSWDKPVCYDRPQPGEEERLVGYDHIN